MGFTTLATAAVSVAKALPDALQAYTLHKQHKVLNNIATEQERMANAQADAMENTAIANQQRAARNAHAQLGAARADAAVSNLAAEGSARLRETDLATRLQDEITHNANSALAEADRTRRQGKLYAWNTRQAAAQARMGSVGAGLSAGSSLFSGIYEQLKE